MDTLPVVTLLRSVPHRLFRGHQWVYGSEIHRVHGTPADGDVVEVRDEDGHPLAIGFYNSRSKITVRVLSRVPVAIDAAFFRARLVRAIAHREAVLPGRPARRLVSSEADLLPGLIVDQYGDVLSVQATSAGMDARLPLLTDLLVELLAPTTILERDDLPVRALEGLPQRRGVLRGPPPAAARMRVGAVEFPWNPLDAHKTGVYLDQQENWAAVARFVRPGDRVLDAFCHLGGFGLHALAAGAGRVVALDSAADAIDGAHQAAEWAGCADRLETHLGNAFDWLRAADEAGERFQVVVLDPPSFTRTKVAVAGALRGYKEIHLRALRMLGPGGVLATFSCSHHVSGPAFLEMVVEAAADAGRSLRLEAVLGASPDHPVLPGVPETEYLKGFVLRVVE